MTEADALAKLDSLYAQYVQRQNWQQAVQNRTQAASFAQLRGRTDLLRQCIQQAIELARDHDLHRLEIRARIERFNYLLIEDLTGQVLDELREELHCEIGAEGAELTGALIGQLERYASAALAAFDALLTNPNQPLPALIESLRLASRQAMAFALVYLGGQFDEALDSLTKGEGTSAGMNEQIHKAASSARSETSQVCASLRVDLFLLAAELQRRLGDPATAEDILRKAEQLSEALPEKRCNVYMAWADLCDSRGKLKLATGFANKAVEASGQISSAALKAQAAAKLSSLLARQEAETPAPSALPGEGATERVAQTLENAHQALLDRRFEDSLNLANRALEWASSPSLRRAVLRERLVVLCELGRFTEAEADAGECISLLSAELSSDAAAAAGAFDNRIREEENLYLIKAWLRAKAGRSVESWDTAERGRSRRLQREIAASSGRPSALPGDATFESIRGWLRSERAAMLSFAATPWGTLALTAGPDDSEPEARILDRFSARELGRLLGSDQSPESETWTGIIFDSIPGLSAGLIHPLLPRLRAITERARVLYITPDSLLYYAPFAALTLDGSPAGPTLIDLCPLAIAPSAAILLWCASRRRAAASRDCLAVAVGRDSTGFEFHDHLARIAAAPWPRPPAELRDEAATAATVAARAPQYPVLYFSCHGSISPESRDLMAACQLELAGEPRLTARDVATWKLETELVFLNACQAGRFPLRARSDVNGFVRAFLLAGARSLIAPLIHVDPRAAGDLADGFFRAWLAGTSAAEALRAAQFKARQENPDRKDWAAYYLTGDFF